MARNDIIRAISSVLKRHKIARAYLFGSFARNEKKFRDIDIAIQPPKGKFSLLDLVGLEDEISGKTGKKIDLVTINSISPYLKPYIEKDMVQIA